MPTLKRDYPALVLLLVEMVLLLFWGCDRNFVTYRQDFGETFVAHQQAAQLSKTASRFGLLHVERSPTGAELVYTHNVNLGTLYFAFLRIFGISSLRAQTIFVFPVFLASLAVAYAVVKDLSKSPAVATVFLALMILDFSNVGAFAFNALRAWHYLALFSAIYGSSLLAAGGSRKSSISATAIVAAGAFLSFGCGYDFFVIVILIATLTPVFLYHSKRLFKSIPIVLILFSVPFLLRQMEVIYWMGVRTWYVDFYTTIAIKVPFASRLIRIPGTNEIDSMYARAGLFRPPALPVSNWIDIWRTVSPLTELSILPNYGLVGCILLLGLIVTAPLFIFGPWRDSRSSNGIRLVSAYAIGSSAGLLAFAPFSLHVYMKHDFPLVAAAVHLAEALAVVMLFNIGTVALAKRSWITGVSLLLLGAFVPVNAVLVQMINAKHSKELDFGWRSFLMSADATGAFQPGNIVAAVAEPPESHTDMDVENHARVIAPDLAPWVLAHRAGLLVDRPIVSGLPLAGKETILIYSPGDGWSNLDAREPDLSDQDWLIELWAHHASKPTTPRSTPYLILAPPAMSHPDDILHLEYFLPIAQGGSYTTYVPRLLVSTPDGKIHEFMNLIESVAAGKRGGSVSLLYNAKFRILDAYFLPPRELLAGRSTRLGIRCVLLTGSIALSSDTTTLVFSEDAPRRPSTAILPEPTTKQMVSVFNWCTLIKQSDVGVGYAIFEIGSRR